MFSINTLLKCYVAYTILYKTKCYLTCIRLWLYQSKQLVHLLNLVQYKEDIQNSNHFCHNTNVIQNWSQVALDEACFYQHQLKKRHHQIITALNDLNTECITESCTREIIEFYIYYIAYYINVTTVREPDGFTFFTEARLLWNEMCGSRSSLHMCYKNKVTKVKCVFIRQTENSKIHRFP